MTNAEPTAELDEGFSSENATATPWAAVEQRLVDAKIFWISTVRPDGRPHVTPLIAVWLGNSIFFSTGPTERKARNLAENSNCVLTTGDSAMDAGLDVVIEGEAVLVRDPATLRRIGDANEAKYGRQWRFDVADDGSAHAGEQGQVLVYEVAPSKVFGFGKGELFSQTRWRFDTDGLS